MTVRPVLTICLLAALAVSGCGKKKAPPEPAAPAPPPGKAVSLDDASSAPPPPPRAPAAPAPDAPAPDGAPVAAGDAEAIRQQELLRLKPAQGDGEIPTQKALIWAVDRWEERYPSLPKDVNELVAKGLLKPLPPPPPGKKYQLDAHNRELSIVNQ